MPLSKILFSYVLTFGVFIVIDMVWLVGIARGLYQREIGTLLADKVVWWAAIVFYLLFVAAILLFVVFPSIEANSFMRAVVMGALFGVVTYATYDLTNMATLKNWSVTITIIDMIWGAVLTGSVSAAGYAIVKWLQ